jgi:hypothetical protein
MTNESLVFPQDNASLISQILEDCGLGENDEEAFKKIKEGKPTNGEMLAEIIKKISYKELQTKNIPSVLKEKFNLPPEKLKKMQQEIEERFFSKKEVVAAQKEMRPKIKTFNPSPEKIGNAGYIKKDVSNLPDTYQEPIE